MDLHQLTARARARRVRPGRDPGEAEATRTRQAWRSGGALFACVLVAGVAVALNDLRVRREAGERYVQALVDSHARQVGQEIANIERALDALAHGLTAVQKVAPGAAPDLAREVIAGIAEGNRRITNLRVEDTAPDFLPRSGSASGRLHLGRPARNAEGRWGIPLAMRLEPGPAGPAWLRAEIDAEIFSQLLRVHDVGSAGVASVLTDDGRLIARSDSGTRYAGRDALASRVFRELALRPRGVVETRSRLDGVRRVVGYRAVEGQPLVATVGMTPSALYGGWWAFVATLALGQLLLLAAWLGGMHLLRRATLRESRMRQSIADSAHTLGHLRERVRDAEEQYRFLYQQHPLPALVFDRETLAILETNDAALQQYGYDRESMLGMGIDGLLAEASATDVRDVIHAHPQAYGQRLWVQRRRDGSTFSAMVFARNLASFAGRPARLALALDVSDRVRAEANLNLLRRAVEASEEGVFIIELARGVMVYGNAACTWLTGVNANLEPSARDAAAMAIADPDARATLLDALQRNQDISVEWADPRGSDVPRWLEVRTSPVFDGDGVASHFVGVVTDITGRKRVAEEMAFRASHDALTGLSNRDRLIEAINDAVARGADRGLAVCHLDLDRFQLVNDSLGHGVGDELLVAVAHKLAAAAGARAHVARLGGDEFGVLLHCDDTAEVAAHVETLRAAVAGTSAVRGVALHVTPSLGYSRFPADGGDGATLLRAASQAGAQAKRLGRNRSVAYRPEFDPRAGDRLLLVQELHRALAREEFELAFQLQFGADDKPCGMEALVRWRHPERGVLGPGEFMDACEDSGIILPLGRWTLREAARCWCLLDERGWGALRMGVNISALQFQERLVEDVARVIAEYHLPRGALELELTESVLLASPSAARRDMAALSRLGASLAIDDFGTGYSSLAYLKHLPLQRLKLDQSFVRDLGRDPDNEAICAAILQMALGLELSVIAEGVETPQQHEWLRRHGCEEFQGFLLARPAAFDDVLRALGEGPGARVAGRATRVE
jgi:diguanylate cyclase (GGDEF)-like protein/PAS domain S-box-containing protein